MTKTRKTVAGLGVLLALAPIAGILLAALLAGALGCEVNEAGPQPCLVFGTDWGGLLSGLLTAGWLALVTIPLLMAVAVVWLAAEAASYAWRRRKLRRLAKHAASP